MCESMKTPKIKKKGKHQRQMEAILSFPRPSPLSTAKEIGEPGSSETK